MERIGGDLEQLVQLKAVFDREAQSVDELTRSITTQLASTTWEGPAANRFREMWSSDFQSSLTRVRTGLHEAATEVSRRVEALRQAGS
jgi:uncharacterized protein YukE